MYNRIILNQLPPDPPPRRSQRLATKSVKKSQQKSKERKSSKMKKQNNSSSKQSQENLIELKKRKSSKKQIIKPKQLSVGVFQSLYNSLIRVKATVQIVQWRKKRQNCYSVRISDGFFRIKVLATGQGGKQLAKDQIKQFYILECFIDHQGQGVCIMSKIFKWYQYGFSIGFTENWRMNKINHNPLGSNKIEWSKWEKFVNHQRGKQTQESNEKESKQKDHQETDNQENTVIMGLSKKSTQSKNGLTSSKRQLSTFKTESVSISGSVSKLQPQQKEKVALKKNAQFRITQQLFVQDQLKKQVGFISASKRNVIQNQNKAMLTANKSNKKISNKQQKSKQFSFNNQYDFLFQKSQVKPKTLMIKGEQQSQKQSVTNKQPQIKISQKIQRTQSLKLNQNEPSDSWDDFLQDFIVFQQAKKNQTNLKQNQNQKNQHVQEANLQHQNKLKILQELFSYSGSNSNSQAAPRSHMDKKNLQRPMIKETQTFSPQNIKSKKSHHFNFDDLFDENSQTSFQIDSKLPPVRISSVKKNKNIYQKIDYNDQNLRKTDKIDLNWISHELSNVKKMEQKQKIKQKQPSDKKGKFTLVSGRKSQKKNINRNQFLNEAENLQSGVFTLYDLIEAQDYQSFCAYKGIGYKDKWYLKLKFLYIQQGEKTEVDPDKSNFLKPNSKIKEHYLKCIATSQNNQFLCTIMLSKQIKEKHNLKENYTYLVQNPIIVENHSSQNQFTSFPQNMYQHWIEISASKNHKIIEVKNSLKPSQIVKQLWIDPLQSIDFKNQNDMVNVMGFIKSVKVNSFGNKSKFDQKNENSNTNKFSSLGSNSQLSKKQPQQNKTMTIIEIIDPLTGFQTQFTQFGNSISVSSKHLFISIFRAKVNYYKNKKSLISKSQTIVVIGEFINCINGQLYKNFFQENIDYFQQVIENVQVQLIGYQQAFSIEQVGNFKQNSKILIKNTKIFSISKITYISCKKCSKKIYQGKCPNCGPCTKQGVVERVLFTGSIGDQTGSLRFFVQKNIAQKYFNKIKHSKFEKYDQNQCNYLQQNPWKANQSIENVLSLACVDVWFSYQSAQKPISIDKIAQGTSSKNITKLLDYLKSGFH